MWEVFTIRVEVDIQMIIEFVKLKVPSSTSTNILMDQVYSLIIFAVFWPQSFIRAIQHETVWYFIARHIVSLSRSIVTIMCSFQWRAIFYSFPFNWTVKSCTMVLCAMDTFYSPANVLPITIGRSVIDGDWEVRRPNKVYSTKYGLFVITGH